ncbi:lacr bacterial regulatory protein hth signature [Lucifera butyrica]|uniref:Lacr bacterial regulatory protein hth signature n=1 Tax=Lucifera butyrica TaxID=1351585 RepID=A0A498R4P0_9FIRM|nr:DeoR/GlpR family DNA-binding transcription regulator [Lucifera butyrica]VBB07656.1 lacr bacterial regulatory protein hth signature [Lucifera butyrica]
MYQEERLQKILTYLQENKRIHVDDICQLYAVSRDTARRDLVKLEERQQIIRTHGGALLSTMQREIKNYQDRLHYSQNEKRIIGKLAASLIQNGDKLILDASTTVQACADYLTAEHCTIITNSVHQAALLAHKPDREIHLLGGRLDNEHHFLYGPQVLSTLSHYFVNKVFIGVVGITGKGLTSGSEEDGHVVRKMIEQAEQVIVLADHSKFGRNGYFKYADLADIDLIVTDQPPSEPYAALCRKNQIHVLFPQK